MVLCCGGLSKLIQGKSKLTDFFGITQVSERLFLLRSLLMGQGVQVWNEELLLSRQEKWKRCSWIHLGRRAEELREGDEE